MQKLIAEENCSVWAEGQAKDKVGGKTRAELGPSPALAVWTTPPGPDEFADTLAKVEPQKVYLFAVDPGEEASGPFINHLSGLVKYALNKKQGLANINILAAALAQRENAVLKGLHFLENRGIVTIAWAKGGKGSVAEVILTPGIARPPSEFESIQFALKAILTETLEYRRYFKNAALPSLFSSYKIG